MQSMASGKVASYPTVRSEMTTFNMQADQERFECNNPFPQMISNLQIAALVPI